MSEPLDPATWTEFFFTVATASAALIGLIDGDRLRHRRVWARRGCLNRRRRRPGGSLYWIGLETIGGLVWAIAGAWRFLIGVVDEQGP